LISGLNGQGIFLWLGSGNAIQGNFIGTDVSGYAPLGVPGEGILIQSSNNNVIGGSAPGAGNVIANCFRANVYLLAGSTGNVVEGNRIGTNAAGTAALGQNGIGVRIGDSGYAAWNNTIGGTAPGSGNLISGNTHGVQISGARSSGNV